VYLEKDIGQLHIHQPSIRTIFYGLCLCSFDYNY